MARRGSRNPPTPNSGIVSPDRVLSSLLDPRPSSLHALDQARALIKGLEDRRLYHPLGRTSPPKSLARAGRASVVSSGPGLSPRLSFAAPHQVSVCVRRKERREVLFAKKRTGKGARSRRRRNQFSDMGC